MISTGDGQKRPKVSSTPRNKTRMCMYFWHSVLLTFDRFCPSPDIYRYNFSNISVNPKKGEAPVQSSQELPSLSGEEPAVLASQETASTASEDMGFTQSTTSTSQESAPDEQLVLSSVNRALEILDQSPIPCKKAKLSNWVSKKIDRACVDLKERLRCNYDPPGSDKTALAEIVNGLKKKYQDVNTTRSEKIQILTVLPDCWSNTKISSEFGASLYMIREAGALKLKDGVLATPKPKTGMHHQNLLS